MNESDDDLLMEEATEETRARGVLERTLVTTGDEGSTICNDSYADRLSLKATNEHASDGAGSDSATVWVYYLCVVVCDLIIPLFVTSCSTSQTFQILQRESKTYVTHKTK